MTIRFDRITITNFGPYYGSNTMEFSTDEHAPVTLLYGENTFGKSQLFAAFRWALYGSLGSDARKLASVEELRMRFNRRADTEGKELMKVDLSLHSENREYRITRKFDPKSAKRSASLKIDTTVIPQGSIESEINRILHPEISEFFLFDGEMLSDFFDRFDDAYSRRLIKEQIEKVIGVPALTNLAGDISHLLSSSSASMSKSSRARTQIAEQEKKKAKADYSVSVLTEQIAKLQDQEAEARARKKEIDSAFARLPEINDDLAELSRLEASQEAIEPRQRELTESMQAVVATSWFLPALGTLQRANSELKFFQESYEEDSRRLTRLETNLENHLHTNSSGTCPTCGHERAPVAEDEISQIRGELESLRQSITPVDLEKFGRIHSAVTSVDTSKYKKLAAESRRLLREASNLKGEIVSKTERLKEYDKSDIRRLADDYSMTQNSLGLIAEKLPALEAELKGHQATQITVDKKIALLSRGAASTREQIEHYTLSTLGSLIGSAVEDFKTLTRQNVEELTSEIFLNLIHDREAYRNITISEDFQMHINSNLREDANTSEGGRQLLALSFISALKQTAVSDGPVVIDSPLGRLDLTHRQRVLERWIPGLGGQAVLLVQSGELERERAREWLQDLVHSEYEIVRPTGQPEVAELRRVQ